MKVNYSGRTSCGCPYINEPGPAKHWKECHYRLNSEKRAALSTQSEVQRLRGALGELLDCPFNVEETTVPRAGVEAAPEQVVLNVSVGLVRWRKARAAIAKAKGEKE